eukprot:TRINITY_DN891_c0_g2_i1.p1 TRINITY_DN891_c0_g2~~TRINITY_DN891_c0_g2_i1.p1  ORF type:complete len:200 (-),score=24.56 TRINITY_DN891_c0_g2_i1:970-1536(-)
MTQVNLNIQHQQLIRHQEELRKLHELVVQLRKDNQVLDSIECDLQRCEEHFDAAKAKRHEKRVLVDLAAECHESLQKLMFSDSRRDALMFASLDELIDGMLDEHILVPCEKKMLAAKLDSAGFKLEDLGGLYDVLRARRLYPKRTSRHPDDLRCEEVISSLPEPDRSLLRPLVDLRTLFLRLIQKSTT